MEPSDQNTNDDEIVLVTGASGYIATHIVKMLLELGYKVRGTVRSLKDEKKISPLKKLVINPKHELELVEADLLNESSWLNAVKGCTYVMHTASPFPSAIPKHEKELIEPAVNGTLFVLRACVQPDCNVKRVILTSSVVAVSGDSVVQNKTYTENDWSDLTNLSPYPKSKTLAEKAAWDFVKEKEKANKPCFELAVINPGFVMGPLLHDSPCTSIEPIKKIMNREVPMLPNLYMPSCDVRDVALAHIRAMKIKEAAGKRHLILTSVQPSSFKDWAIILDKEFRPKNYNIPLTVAPNCFMKLYSIFDSTLKQVVPLLGVKPNYDNNRFVNELKIKPTNLKDSLIDMSYSLIEREIILKK